MRLEIDDDFRTICKAIVSLYDREGDRSLVWNEDQYQVGKFAGGWVPDKSKFYFSYYAPDGSDYIFSFTLEEARVVANGGVIDPPLEYWKQSPDWT